MFRADFRTYGGRHDVLFNMVSVVGVTGGPAAPDSLLNETGSDSSPE